MGLAVPAQQTKKAGTGKLNCPAAFPSFHFLGDVIRYARRLVQQGGIVVDEKKVESIDESIPQEKFAGEGVIIRKGKKVFHKAVTR